MPDHWQVVWVVENTLVFPRITRNIEQGLTIYLLATRRLGEVAIGRAGCREENQFYGPRL
jgi:hypothetical protein